MFDERLLTIEWERGWAAGAWDAGSLAAAQCVPKLIRDCATRQNALNAVGAQSIAWLGVGCHWLTEAGSPVLCVEAAHEKRTKTRCA